MCAFQVFILKQIVWELDGKQKQANISLEDLGKVYD